MTTTEQQPDLFTPRPAAVAPATWLESLLFERKGWMTAREIMGLPGVRVIDRELREMASTNHNILSGQKGYKHVAHATPEEVNHAASWLVSQGKLMIKRGIGIRRHAHKFF